jgi:uncharacterized SAM-binding protein YcdF (DUF218 family)
MFVLVLLAIVGVAFAGLFAAVSWTLVRIAIAGRQRPVESADAIVVFGAEATPSGPCRELAARLDHAAALYRQGKAPVILCCGGRSGAISEAVVMAAYLCARGLPAEAVLSDESCPSTRAALAATRRRAAGSWRTVLLVSSPYHLHRIMSEARRWGVAAIASPTSRTPVMVRASSCARQVLREVVAVWWYAVTAATGNARAREPCAHDLASAELEHDHGAQPVSTSVSVARGTS